MEGMDSFQKNMKDTRHVLWANHPEYTGEVKSAKVAQAEIADLTAKLTGMNVIEEMHERPMAFLAMLDSFPDLGAVRGTSPHLNNEIINLTKNQEWWKEFCAQAWMNGENSFYFQAIKDLAKKQVPQALLFIGQHALEQNNDPATAWHCLTTAQNGPYKAVLKVGYATETTSLLTDLNRNPSALMAALGNASAKGSVEAIAQTQSHQPTAITVKNPTVNPLLKDGKASASVTSPNTPAPPIQPVQNR